MENNESDNIVKTEIKMEKVEKLDEFEILVHNSNRSGM